MAKRERATKVVWLLMHHGADGWLPSMDYAFPWRTKKAALAKIADLGERGKMYVPFKYILAEGQKS